MYKFISEIFPGVRLVIDSVKNELLNNNSANVNL
jgi:hypothetical protein